jgi:hypothetical protein
MDTGKRGRKHSHSMDEGISSPQGMVGKAFEDWLTQKYGGEGAFRVDGRDFDGGQGNRWWEAKSGRYWVDHVRDEISVANTPIPPSIKAWLTRKGIPFTELLE